MNMTWADWLTLVFQGTLAGSFLFGAIAYIRNKRLDFKTRISNRARFLYTHDELKKLGVGTLYRSTPIWHLLKKTKWIITVILWSQSDVCEAVIHKSKNSNKAEAAVEAILTAYLPDKSPSALKSDLSELLDHERQSAIIYELSKTVSVSLYFSGTNHCIFWKKADKLYK